MRRAHIPVAAGASRPQLDVGDHCYGLSAYDPQSRLLRDAQKSDAGFQGAVA